VCVCLIKLSSTILPFTSLGTYILLARILGGETAAGGVLAWRDGASTVRVLRRSDSAAIRNHLPRSQFEWDSPNLLPILFPGQFLSRQTS
jgi:hypothetical protein